MALAVRPSSWHRDAACLEHPELDWFATDDGTIARCRAVCNGCNVAIECLAEAVADGLPFGVRGGLTGRERRELRL